MLSPCPNVYIPVVVSNCAQYRSIELVTPPGPTVVVVANVVVELDDDDVVDT